MAAVRRTPPDARAPDAAEGRERYCHQYVGQKRFSLEGGESLIPLLDDMIAARQQRRHGHRPRHGHRGRLNV